MYDITFELCGLQRNTADHVPFRYERFSTAPLFFLLESTASAVFIISRLFPFGGGNFPAIRFLLQRYIEVPHAERLRDHVGRGAGLVSTGQDSLKIQLWPMCYQWISRDWLYRPISSGIERNSEQQPFDSFVVESLRIVVCFREVVDDLLNILLFSRRLDINNNLFDLVLLSHFMTTEAVMIITNTREIVTTRLMAYTFSYDGQFRSLSFLQLNHFVTAFAQQINQPVRADKMRRAHDHHSVSRTIEIDFNIPTHYVSVNNQCLI